MTNTLTQGVTCKACDCSLINSIDPELCMECLAVALELVPEPEELEEAENSCTLKREG